MTTLRRSESDRRAAPTRDRPSSFYENTTGLTNGSLTHAASTDGIHLIETSAALAASKLRNHSKPPNIPTPLVSHVRSVSHRDLRLKKMSTDSFVDAFNFVSSNSGPSNFHCRSKMDMHHHSEISHQSHATQPVPPARRDSRYHPMLPNRQQTAHQQHQSRNMVSSQPNLRQHPYPENQQNQSNSDFVSNQSDVLLRRGYQPSDTEHTNSYTARHIVNQPEPVKTMNTRPSFGPVVSSNDNVKKLMKQKAQSGESSGSEVISEKGRSVKSIIGLFDHSGASGAHSDSRFDCYEQQTFQQHTQTSQHAIQPQTFQQQTQTPQPQDQTSKPQRAQRGDTQVVHLAHLVQIGTPQKSTVSDAQTSPMQLSPNEVVSAPVPGAQVVKAETYHGNSRPKVAIITHSSSSTSFPDVFSTPDGSIDTPVFDLSAPFNGTEKYTNEPNPDIPHRLLPNSLNLQQQCQTVNGGDRDSNHYEELDSPRLKPDENIYEPITPATPAEPYPTTPGQHPTTPSQHPSTPGQHLLTLGHNQSVHEGWRQQQRVEPMIHEDMDRAETPESQSYSDKLRQASHFAVRQTSVDKRSPSQEDGRTALTTERNHIHSPTCQPSNDHYRSDGNMFRHDKLQRPNRAESYRTQRPTSPVKRANSYKDVHKTSSSSNMGGDQRVDIKEQLRDFVIRKTGDFISSDESRENSYNIKQNDSYKNDSYRTQSNSYREQNNRPIMRIHSESHFRSKSNVQDNRRSMEITRSPRTEVPAHIIRHGSDSSTSNYMNSWEGLSGQRISTLSNSSSDQSPISPHSVNTDGTPRVKKPLIAEVQPFPGRNRKDRSQRNDTNSSSSSAGSSGLKPVKVRSNTVDGSEGPPLPPRLYYNDSDSPHNNNTAHVQTAPSPTHPPPIAQRNNSNAQQSQADKKPYENLWQGGKQTDTAAVDQYESDYSKRIKALSKNIYHKDSRGSSFSASSLASPTNPQQLLSTVNSVHNNNVRETNMDDFASELPRPPPRNSIQHDVPPPKPPKSDTRREFRSHSSPMVPEDVKIHAVVPQRTEEDRPVENPVKNSPFLNADQTQPEPAKPSWVRKHAVSSTSRVPMTHTPPHIKTNEPRRSVDHTMKSIELSPAEDTSVKSAPPDAINKIARRRSIGKNDRRHSESVVRTSINREHSSDKIQITPPTEQSAHEDLQSATHNIILNVTPSQHNLQPTQHNLQPTQHNLQPTQHNEQSHQLSVQHELTHRAEIGVKPSPLHRKHKETEFSAEEPPKPADRRITTTEKIHDGAPVPFNRYNKQSNSTTSLENISNHSRTSSAELLEICRSANISPIPAMRDSPQLPPRSPKSHGTRSLSSSRSNSRASNSSPSVSRKSTPSPQTNNSSEAQQQQPFTKISDEIHQVLREKGININGKTAASNEECHMQRKKPQPASPTTSPPPSGKPLKKHIRQKSSDELLLDVQVEHLTQSIKDEENIGEVFPGTGKRANDYIPELFDGILNVEIPRKPRSSMDGTSPCHSKQSSAGDGLKVDTDNDKLQSISKKDELISVLGKKLELLVNEQKELQQELKENDELGVTVAELVETRCSSKELSRYKTYMEKIDTVTKLVLKLSRRLAKAENSLINAPSDSTDDDKKSLEQKRNDLQKSYDEAKMFKQEIDNSKPALDSTLTKRLEPCEFTEYDVYINKKLKLTVELHDVDEQITSCKEQINVISAFST